MRTSLKTTFIALTALFASLVAGCGGGGGSATQPTAPTQTSITSGEKILELDRISNGYIDLYFVEDNKALLSTNKTSEFSCDSSIAVYDIASEEFSCAPVVGFSYNPFRDVNEDRTKAMFGNIEYFIDETRLMVALNDHARFGPDDEIFECETNSVKTPYGPYSASKGTVLLPEIQDLDSFSRPDIDCYQFDVSTSEDFPFVVYEIDDDVVLQNFRTNEKTILYHDEKGDSLYLDGYKLSENGKKVAIVIDDMTTGHEFHNLTVFDTETKETTAPLLISNQYGSFSSRFNNYSEHMAFDYSGNIIAFWGRTRGRSTISNPGGWNNPTITALNLSNGKSIVYDTGDTSEFEFYVSKDGSNITMINQSDSKIELFRHNLDF